MKFDTLRCRWEKIARACCPNVHPIFQALKKLTSFNFIDFPDRNISNFSHFSIFFTWFFTWLFHDFTWFFRVISVWGGGGGGWPPPPPHHPTLYASELPSMYYNHIRLINKFCLSSPYQISNDFAFGLYDLDWDVFSTHIEGAVNRVPVIGETGVKSTVCGPGIYSWI